MTALIFAAITLQFALGFSILARAIREECFVRYTFFYSFLIYFLASGVVGIGILVWAPQHYAVYFWIKFLTLVVAEFVLLVQISDHIFSPYPALRQLGRTVTLGITAIFFITYIVPSLLQARPSEEAIYDLVKRSAVTKGIIFLAIGLMVWRFRLHLGRNIVGIAVGLITFLSINIVNFALVQSLGWDGFGKVFSTVGPLSQTLMVLIWAVSLWHYDPVSVRRPTLSGAAELQVGDLDDRLGRYNDALDRLLRK